MAPMAGGMAFIKPKPASVQLLERQLASSDPDVRKAGIDSIPRIQAPVEPLSDCLVNQLEHQNWYVRRTGVQAAIRAVESKDAAQTTITDTLGTRLASSDAEVRRCAGSALVGIVDAAGAAEPSSLIPEGVAEASAIEAAEKLEDYDPRVRQTAVEALARMGEVARPHVRRAAARLEDSDPSVRRSFVTACATLGAVATEAASEIGGLASHREDFVRRSAANAILALSAHSGKEAAAATAAQLSAEHVTGRISREVLLLLAELGPLSAPHGGTIAAVLDSQDPGLRSTAIRTLVQAGPTVAATAIAPLQRRMECTSRESRRAAVDAMRALAPMTPAIASAVGVILHEEPEEQTEDTLRQRCDVFRILGGAEANAAPFLEDMAYGLEERDWSVRRAAIEAFEDLREHAEDAAAAVAKRLLHNEADVRRSAVECLGRMGVHCGPYASRVEAMLDTEEDEDVIRTCQEAYELLQEAGNLESMSQASPPPSPQC